MGFKQYLDSLKLSSKDAIVDGEKDSLSDLKKYLHIERTVEKALGQLVLKAAISSTSQLILLLGNVGDGKSHLLAKMWEAHPNQLKNFRVYNDATESAFKNKSYLENLLEVFKPYSDDELIKPSIPIKTIIAINLGTLTNFLEEAGEGFANLRQYVSINHLIEDRINHSTIEADSCFHTLALTDYHIFSLSPTGASSKVLLDIIKRVTQKTNENPFYTSYKEFYEAHPLPNNCPIKYNFDMLRLPLVQQTLSELLVKVVLSDKMIISVRLLMNLIFDLIVPPPFTNLSDEEIKQKTLSITLDEDFYQYTLPVLLFDSPATSQILKCFQLHDPVSNTNEELDEVIINLGTVIDPRGYYTRFGLLQENDSLYLAISNLKAASKIKLFLRLHYILRIKDQLQTKDILFADYINNLYLFNAGKKRELLPLYKKVQQAIYQWNGTSRFGADYINLNIGRKQSTYKISQKLQLQFAPISITTETTDILEKFSNTLVTSFQVQSHPKVFNLEIDFSLYQLIIKINKGYRPNRVDKSIHVKFTQFVNDLINYQSQTKELIIQEFNGETRHKYKLSFIPGFDDFQFSETE